MTGTTNALLPMPAYVHNFDQSNYPHHTKMTDAHNGTHNGNKVYLTNTPDSLFFGSWITQSIQLSLTLNIEQLRKQSNYLGCPCKYSIEKSNIIEPF